MIKEGDFILIIDFEDVRYLQVGEVIDIEYEYDGDIKIYRVRFADKEVVEYDYRLIDDYKCKVIMFERR